MQSVRVRRSGAATLTLPRSAGRAEGRMDEIAVDYAALVRSAEVLNRQSAHARAVEG